MIKGSEVAYAYNDTYGFSLYAVFNATDESLAALAKKYHIEEPENLVMEDSTARCFNQKKDGSIVIAIKPVRPQLMFSSMAHEAVHVIDFLYKHYGMDHKGKHDEPTAYLTGWIHYSLYDAAVDAAHAYNASRKPKNQK
jgi:hypothetical protein